MVGHAHRLLSKALKEAMRFDLVIKNVASTEKPPKVDSEEVQIVPADKVKPMLDSLKGQKIYPLAVLALFCGLRRGEIAALKWQHVDLDGKVLSVREAVEETKAHGIRIKPPKSKAGRRDITMPDIVIDTLREHRRAQLELRMKLGLGKPANDGADLLLFPTHDGRHRSPLVLSQEWIRAAEAIGMSEITFHALRHTHASQLIDQGIDVVTISKRLGHSKPGITLNTYAHLFKLDDGKAAEAVNKALANW
jgi:integrase